MPRISARSAGRAGGRRGGCGGRLRLREDTRRPWTIDSDFWAQRRVLITGHTGFKGAWLSLWLQSLGAEVSGALRRRRRPSPRCTSSPVVGAGDARACTWTSATRTPCAGRSPRPGPRSCCTSPPSRWSGARCAIPRSPTRSNVIGTVNVLEAVRAAGGDVRAVVVVTSDKCYENPGSGPRRFVEERRARRRATPTRARRPAPSSSRPPTGAPSLRQRARAARGDARAPAT